MYDILALNEKKLEELKDIAKDLNIKKIASLKKQELIYKILDEQAVNPKKVVSETPEVKPTEVKPTEVKPTEVKPTEAKTNQTVENKPVNRNHNTHKGPKKETNPTLFKKENDG